MIKCPNCKTEFTPEELIKMAEATGIDPEAVLLQALAWIRARKVKNNAVSAIEIIKGKLGI